jgi:hypothetical protein
VQRGNAETAIGESSGESDVRLSKIIIAYITVLVNNYWNYIYKWFRENEIARDGCGKKFQVASDSGAGRGSAKWGPEDKNWKREKRKPPLVPPTRQVVKGHLAWVAMVEF